MTKTETKKKVLKTENMKTTMKKLAAGTFIALILLVGNVQAEGTEAITPVKAIETTLHLEKWMTTENLWNSNSLDISGYTLETESSLELENWMISAETWHVNSSINEEKELEMELENWMTTSETWNIIDFNEETETEITVEHWMTSENIWNR